MFTGPDVCVATNQLSSCHDADGLSHSLPLSAPLVLVCDLASHSSGSETDDTELMK